MTENILEYILFDSQDGAILDHKKMTTREAVFLNNEARAVGEIYLQWEPALFKVYRSGSRAAAR